MHEARDAIADVGFVVLVEGYFDLLACAQYGFRNTVAPLGTAFTEDHAKLLARFTRKAVIGFDGDNAGQAAAERTVGIFLGQGFQVNVVRLATGDDPDSLLRAEGTDGLRAALKNSDAGLEYMIRRAGERTGLDTPRGKAEALSSLAEFVVPVNDRVERAEWIGRLAERLDVEPRFVNEAVNDARSRLQRRRSPTPHDEAPPQAPREVSWKADLDKVPLAEREMLRAVLDHPEWGPPLAELCAPENIRDARIRALLAAIDTCREEGIVVDSNAVLAHCELPGCESLLSRLRLDDGEIADWDAARNCALGIHDDSLKRRLRQMTHDIRAALAAGDQARFSELNREKILLAQRIGSA